MDLKGGTYYLFSGTVSKCEESHEPYYGVSKLFDIWIVYFPHTGLSVMVTSTCKQTRWCDKGEIFLDNLKWQVGNHDRQPKYLAISQTDINYYSLPADMHLHSPADRAVHCFNIKTVTSS
jgi:hypothetical protein